MPKKRCLIRELKAQLTPPKPTPRLYTVGSLADMAWSVRFQRGGSGTNGALPRLRQSRYVPLPAGCLTLINDHRLFILRPRCFTSPPGPAPTGRHA